jgi:hypothetical protein
VHLHYPVEPVSLIRDHVLATLVRVDVEDGADVPSEAGCTGVVHGQFGADVHAATLPTEEAAERAENPALGLAVAIAFRRAHPLVAHLPRKSAHDLGALVGREGVPLGLRGRHGKAGLGSGERPGDPPSVRATRRAVKTTKGEQA